MAEEAAFELADVQPVTFEAPSAFEVRPSRAAALDGAFSS